jgi:hypothetical protein
MNGAVQGLHVWNGNLVAVGSFTTAGGVSANRIATWDGAAWNSFGSGLNNRADALVTYNGDLVVGGFFTQADGLTVNRIARWNGYSWNAMGSGIEGCGLLGGQPPFVRALGTFAGSLFAGGWFINAGLKPSNFIAEWSDPGTSGVANDRGMRLGARLAPNPMSRSVRIEYTVPFVTRIAVQVCDVQGRLIATLVDRHHEKGPGQVVWAGIDQSGNAVPNGIYFIKVLGESFQQSLRLVVSR